MYQVVQQSECRTKAMKLFSGVGLKINLNRAKKERLKNWLGSIHSVTVEVCSVDFNLHDPLFNPTRF
jgi:hypothetical protein